MTLRKPRPEELPSIRALSGAALCGCVLLGLIVLVLILPAEHGMDPTGIGSRLGLTRMGLLKQALAAPDAHSEGRPSLSHEMTLTLGPDEATEVKMDMKKGYITHYRWKASHDVRHDTHGDLYADENAYISYSTGDAVSLDQGEISAIFDGRHGWYWKNEGTQDVTIELKTKGQYSKIFQK